jgi:hypothetical protein
VNQQTVLSLTHANFMRLLKVFGGMTSILAIVIIAVRWQGFDAPWWSAIWQGVSLSMTISTIGLGIFSNMTWTSPMLAKWLERPIVHGVWLGELESSYKDANGATLQPIKIYLAIKQTYLTLAVDSFTQTQDGESSVEAILQNSRTQATRLSYIFELRRQYAGENKLTAGAGELKLVEAGTRLKGHYWTNSPTHGNLSLRLVSRNRDGVHSFADAVRVSEAHPISSSA